MKYRIYGFDANRVDFFERYTKVGISEMVSGKDEERISKSNSNGVGYYICTGAFGCPDEAYWSKDVEGTPKKWFGSGCPNSEYIRKKNLDSIRELAKTPGIKGIIIDGARFASLASSEGFDAFFTCFCDNCMAKMKKLGFDADKIKEAVTCFRSLCLEGKLFDKEKYMPYLEDWIKFRRICTTEHFKNVRDVIKGENPDLIFGAYIFTPAINRLVGQVYEDLKDICDELSPMIYRHYKKENGPACIDHEIRAILDVADGKSPEAKKMILEVFGALGKNDYEKYGTSEQIKANGVKAEVIGEETEHACQMSCDTPVVPIILLDDVLMEDTLNGCFKAPIEKIDFFLYEEKAFDTYSKFFK